MWLWIYTKRMWYHFLPHSAFRNRKETESWVEPESDLRLLLSSLIQSSGLGMRLPAKALKISRVWIHTTCTSSAYSGCTIASHKCKSNNQANCYSFPLHPTTSSLLHAMHCLLTEACPTMQPILLVIYYSQVNIFTDWVQLATYNPRCQTTYITQLDIERMEHFHTLKVCRITKYTNQKLQCINLTTDLGHKYVKNISLKSKKDKTHSQTKAGT